MCYTLDVGDDVMSCGKRISVLRKQKGFTQKELADILFVSDKAISSWEQNRTEPSLEFIMKLSEVLECSVSYLIYGDNPKNNIETEIKIKLTENEFKYLDSFMSDNAKFLNESNHHDIYYEPSYRKFLTEDKINEWLRIGERGNKKILTYKNYHNNNYCDEYEVEIDDSSNLDKIFNVLGLSKIGVVDKKRKTYFYLDKYEVSLDFVNTLGYFIEIEVKKIETNQQEEYDRLLKVAKDINLNLDNIEIRRYPYQIICKNK